MNMSSTGTLKSALKHPMASKSYFPKRIGFDISPEVELKNREYGFLRATSDKRGTPYPRAQMGIDVEVLKERLEAEKLRTLEQARETKSPQKPHRISLVSDTSSTTSRAHRVRLSRLKHIGSNQSMKKRDILGTPHPKAGIALDPLDLYKSLKTSGDSSAPSFRAPGPRQTRASLGFSFDLINDPVTREINKQIGSTTNVIPDSKNRLKNASSHQMDLRQLHDVDKESSTEFCKRRRLFNEAEFTIARNGKKMSDKGMELREKIEVTENSVWQNDAQKAKVEIDNYIQMLTNRHETTKTELIFEIIRSTLYKEDID